MEGIVAIVLVIAAIVAFRLIVFAGARTAGAAARAALGKGSFSENMELAFKGMGAFQIRLVDKRLGENDDGIFVKEIQGKGLFPLARPTRIGFVTSVFDNSTGALAPILSALEAFQESDSTVYRHGTEIGSASPNQGYIGWVPLGVVLPDILQPPFGGKRNVIVIVRMIDLDQPPAISQGFHQKDQPGLLWQGQLDFSYSFTEKGYKEEIEHRDEAVAVAIKIGMAVAMSDGLLNDSEGEVLRNWVVRAVAPFAADRQNVLKKIYNDAMRGSYIDAKNGTLSLSILTSRLNEIGDKKTKYEALELCFDIMAADGVAKAQEVRVIRQIAMSLGLDIDEIDKMRDQRIITLNSTVANQASIEDLLGIEKNWDSEMIRKHLRAEFQKWNNRLGTLTEGEARANAQKMLDLIAEARRKYG